MLKLTPSPLSSKHQTVLWFSLFWFFDLYDLAETPQQLFCVLVVSPGSSVQRSGICSAGAHEPRYVLGAGAWGCSSQLLHISGWDIKRERDLRAASATVWGSATETLTHSCSSGSRWPLQPQSWRWRPSCSRCWCSPSSHSLGCSGRMVTVYWQRAKIHIICFREMWDL